MPDYSKAKLYKLYSLCNPKLVYYGSTCEPTLARRLAKHVGNYKSYLRGKTSYVTSYRIIETKLYKIELIKHYPCKTKDELRRAEGELIKNNECVNKLVAGRTLEQYKKDNIIQIKERYNLNKEKYKETRKIYYDKNKAIPNTAVFDADARS